LKIKEHLKKGIYVENLSEYYISSQEEFLVLIHEAEKCRIVKETGLNKCSSRSHLLFQLQITQKLPDDTERRGTLNLIDLAGSEKVSKTHAMGETLNEAKKINSSLSTLGKVISTLATNSGEYVPYRESKLTRILQDSLGGNSKTILIVNCSIHSYNADETIYTLNFAKRAKKIKNKVKINIKHSAEQLEAIIEALSQKLRLANEEIARLKGTKRDAADDSPTHSYAAAVNNDLNNSVGPSRIVGLANVNNNNEKALELNKEVIRSLNEKLKNKDEEILLLTDKLDALQQEIKNIQEKLENTHKQNNIDQYIENLDKSLKKNLENLREILLSNRNDEVEMLTLRMKEIKNFYEDFEKNYLYLFKRTTDSKDMGFEKKMKMILNDNFTELLINNTNNNFTTSNSKTNLNVNINNFNNFNNITVNNQAEVFDESNNLNYNADRNPKKKELKRNIILNSNNNSNSIINNDQNYNLKNNLESIDSYISPDKKPLNKKLNFGDSDSSIVNITNTEKRNSTSKGVLILNNELIASKNNDSIKIGFNNAPTAKKDKIFDYRCSLKKGKIKTEKTNILSNIPNPSSNKERNPLKTSDDNNNPLLNNNEEEQVLSVLNSKRKSIQSESYRSNVDCTDKDLKANILSGEVIKALIEPKKRDFAHFELENEENNHSLKSVPEFGGKIFKFNLNCEEIFKKIEMHISSKSKATSSELIVLSYKKLFLSNKVFSTKIFDEFLKRKEEYGNNLQQNNSIDNLLSLRNNITYTDNLFSRQPTVDNLLFSAEYKNNGRNNDSVKNFNKKEEYYMSPKSNKADKNEKDYIKEFENSQVIFNEQNLFNNKTFNNYFDTQSKNSRAANSDNKNNNFNNNKFLDSDYFLRMKNCINKLVLKIIYFENINYDLLSRLSIDLSKKLIFIQFFLKKI